MASFKQAARVALLLAIALVASVGFATRADAKEDPASFVGRMLAAAPSNFQTLRLGVRQHASSGDVYATSAALHQVCPYCLIADDYADASYDERWELSFSWSVPKNWSDAQTIAYVKKTFSPLVPGYQFTSESNSNLTYVTWFNKTSKTFLYVETYDLTNAPGFRVRVGHYLPKNLHVVLFSRGLTAADKQLLTTAVRSFVQLSLNDADSNFTSLRGQASPGDFFEVNHSFGKALKLCDISGMALTDPSATPKWIMECQTPEVGGGQADVKELLRAAVVAELPAGFTATTDPKYLGTSAYRWDRSSDLVSVNIDAYTHGASTSYHIQVFHFLR